MSVRWTSFLVIVGLLGGISGNLLAQTDLGDFLKPKKPKVGSAIPKAVVAVTADPATFKPAGMVKLAVQVDVPAGYHIYGTDGDFGGRTMIRIETPGLDPLGDGFVPNEPGKTAFDPDLDAKVTKHEGTVVWTREFRTPPGVAGDGSLTIKGRLEGQYCSDPEHGGKCVPLKSAFELVLAAAGPAAASSAVRYEDTLKPMRKTSPSPDPVEYLVRLNPAHAAKGETVTVEITAKLQPGWHSYSLTQKDIGGEPTEIELEALRNLEAIDAHFKPSVPPKIETSDMGNSLETYHDDVTWSRQYRMTGETAGDYGVSGTITYQLCDSVRCLLVHTAPFALGQVAAAELPPIEMPADDEPAASPFAPVAVPEAPRIEPPVIAVKEAVKPAAAPKDQTLLPFNVFILVCIAGGFGALLTPCSYPMVPITVSFFLKQSEKEHKPPLLLAVVYCGTIILAFTVIGVGLSYAFGKTFANDLANNSILNWIIGSVFVAFALNMLGAFEIRVPSFLLNWTASRGGSGGYVGAIFMALTFTLTSFTCTFAIVGGLITQAADGQFFRPIMGMLAFGTAFASPFFVLAMLPQLLKKMPKSGGWMNAVKVVMGLIELGAAVKFYSVADNPNPILFDYVTVMIIWAVLCLAIGLYLLGFYRFEHDSPVGPIPLESGLLAIGFLGLAGMLGFLTVFPDRATGVVMENIVSFAPPNFDVPQVASPTRSGPDPSTKDEPAVVHHGLRFVMDFRHAFALAQKEKRPVMIDFTGVNCANCRKMERVMARPENHERLQKFVTAALYVDQIPIIQDTSIARRMLEENRSLEVKYLNDTSMPNYAIVAPDGETVLAKHNGYNEGSEFTEFLDEGWKNWQARERLAALKSDLELTMESFGRKYLLDFDKAREAARSRGGPMLIGFVGVNDVNSRAIQSLMSKPELQQRVDHFVGVQLYVDQMPKINDRELAEKILSDNRELMNKMISEIVIPSYVIMTPDGKQILGKQLGYATTDQFAKFLDEGWKNWQARERLAAR